MDDDRCKRCGEPYANDLTGLCMDCECGEHGTCTRTGCDLPTLGDDVCWWCRNEDADTYFAVETDA